MLGGEAGKGTLFDQSINGGRFYLQSEWDNARLACLMKPAPLTEASFVNGPIEPVEGRSVQFTGRVTDPYRQPQFTWSFGDGTEAGGGFPQHTYAKAGEYKVVMAVKDGLTDALAPHVEETVVVDELPEASFTVEGATTVKVPVKFGALAKDSDGTINKYKLDFGDGQHVEGGELKSEHFEHPYANPGLYSVTLTVEDSSKITVSTSKEIRVSAPLAEVSGGKTPPNSSFVAKARANASTGAISIVVSVANPGKFSWLASFANGKFGVFSASASKCKKGYIRLAGKCRPATIVYARGSTSASGAGTLTVTLRPSASARKALATARKRQKGLLVSVTLSFQSSLDGAPASSTITLTVRLKKK